MFKGLYDKLKSSYLDELGFTVPERYRSSFVHWGGGADVQFIYRRFLQGLAPSARVLLVGAMGGRDYFLLKNLGFDVVALDLGPQPEIEPIVIANVEDPLPFPEASFDAVIMGEVLEHLKRDVGALENIRRVLKPGGRLAVSLPFYNDWEEGHMRIHSPESGRRLLAMGGFAVSDYLERPGLFNPVRLNPLLHAVSLISYAVTRHTAYPRLTRWTGRFEWATGHLRWPRPLRRLSRHFGGYYLCYPTAPSDAATLNRRLYTTAATDDSHPADPSPVNPPR